MKIWLNHWFSSAYHFIDMLKEKGYYVIGTNSTEPCIYSINANEFYTEPIIEDTNAYIDWCLNFCLEHNIDVFFIKRGMEYAIKRIDEFKDINVKVICEQSIENYILLNDKYKSNIFIKEHNICDIPDMKIVNNVQEFETAYNELSRKYEEICVKYNIDEGGVSYKLIDNNKNNLSNNSLTRISYNDLVNLLTSMGQFKDLIVMPYLNGTEISIDCLGLGNNLLAIPRYKISSRFTKIKMDENLIEIANKFYKELPLDGPFNIQLRYHNDKLYFMEVNTRLSGGSWKLKNIGCEFPVLCVEKALGILKELPKIDVKEAVLGNLESCLVVSKQ